MSVAGAVACLEIVIPAAHRLARSVGGLAAGWLWPGSGRPPDVRRRSR